MSRVRIPTREEKRRAAVRRFEVLFLIFAALYITLFACASVVSP